MPLGYYPNRGSDKRYRYTWWKWNWRGQVNRYYRRNQNALPTAGGMLQGKKRK